MRGIHKIGTVSILLAGICLGGCGFLPGIGQEREDTSERWYFETRETVAPAESCEEEYPVTENRADEYPVTENCGEEYLAAESCVGEPAESATKKLEISLPELAKMQEEAREWIPHFDEKFFLTQLTAGELQDACALYRSLMNFEEKCQLPYGLSVEQLEKVYSFLYYECPELIQFAGEREYQYWSRSVNDLVSEVEPVYTMDKTAYEQALPQVEARMRELCGGLEGLSDWEKELQIYRRIVLSYTYDAESEHCGNSYGLLVEGRAKCVGVARTVKWALDELGIPNYILGGASRIEGEEGHVWNVLQLDGGWYDFDATVQFDSDEELLYPAVNVSRYWIRDQYEIYAPYLDYELPGAETMEDSYYGREGNFVPAGIPVENLIDQRLTECYEQGGGSFTLQFESEADFQKVVENMDTYCQDWTDNRGSAWWNAGKYWLEGYRIYRVEVEVLE